MSYTPKIADLQKQLEQNKISMENLTAQYGQLSRQSEEQLQTIAQQSESLQQQDQVINEGYVKMGTKQELKAAGLIQGGFLKKTKVNYSNIDMNQFQAVDIRQVTEIDIPSKKAKVLSPMPSNSYEFRKEGASTVLLITDPIGFWSVTKYLIIQTN